MRGRGVKSRATTAPLRTLLMLASFAVTAYAAVRLHDGRQVIGLVLWFAGAALLHDLALLPLYSLADRTLQRVLRRGVAPSPPVNHVRVPVFLSGMLLLVWYPLVLRRAPLYEPYSALEIEVFLPRWLLLTAAFFAASALALVLRTLLTRRAPPTATARRRTPSSRR